MLLARSTCRFGTITPALLHMLEVIEEHARCNDLTVIVLCGTETTRPGGIAEAHHRGEAIDLRCQTLSSTHEKRRYLDVLLERLGPCFVGALEHVNTPNEHLHLQLRRGAVYDPPRVRTHAGRFDR